MYIRFFVPFFLSPVCLPGGDDTIKRNPQFAFRAEEIFFRSDYITKLRRRGEGGKEEGVHKARTGRGRQEFVLFLNVIGPSKKNEEEEEEEEISLPPPPGPRVFVLELQITVCCKASKKLAEEASGGGLVLCQDFFPPSSLLHGFSSLPPPFLHLYLALSFLFEMDKCERG